MTGAAEDQEVIDVPRHQTAACDLEDEVWGLRVGTEVVESEEGESVL